MARQQLSVICRTKATLPNDKADTVVISYVLIQLVTPAQETPAGDDGLVGPK